MAVPNPMIYLRNKFVIKPNAIPQFLYGKETLIRSTMPNWHLIAACADRPILADTNVAEPSLAALQIWKIDQWQSLYEKVYEFSDSGWYNALGSSLASENQQLLVGVLGGDTGSKTPQWDSETVAGYCYLYEEALAHHGLSQRYVRALNTFAALATETCGWSRAWTALQVTAAPAEVSVLWKVPGDIGEIETDLQKILAPNDVAQWYRTEMMATLKTLSRQRLYPIFSERIAQRVVGMKETSQIIPTPDPLFGSRPSISPRPIEKETSQ